MPCLIGAGTAYQTFLAFQSENFYYTIAFAGGALSMGLAACGIFCLSALAFSSENPLTKSRAIAANIALFMAGVLLAIGFAAVLRQASAALTIAAMLGLPAVINLIQLLRR